MLNSVEQQVQESYSSMQVFAHHKEPDCPALVSVTPIGSVIGPDLHSACWRYRYGGPSVRTNWPGIGQVEKITGDLISAESHGDSFAD